MHTRAQGIVLDDTRSFGKFFTQWLISQPVGCTWTIGGKERQIVHRILGMRCDGKYVQLPPRWRDRLKAAGLDEEWNVTDSVLWEHAVWQVQTTGVFRPERQAGLHELLGDQEPDKPGTPKNVPGGASNDTRSKVSQSIPNHQCRPTVSGQTDGEISLSETIARALKR